MLCNIADREDMANVSTSEAHVKRFKHLEVSYEDTLPLPCADGVLNTCDCLRPHRGEVPAGGNALRKKRNRTKRPHQASMRNAANTSGL